MKCPLILALVMCGSTCICAWCSREDADIVTAQIVELRTNYNPQSFIDIQTVTFAR